MPKTHEFVEYLLHDAFGGLAGVTARSMFGGYGLYKDGQIFAIVDQDAGKVYFRVNDTNLADFTARGMEPFTYTAKGKTMTMKYYELPLDILENPEDLAVWTNKACNRHFNAKCNI
jgi:DNA transformation protein and related proteins